MKFEGLTAEQLEKAANLLKAIAHPMRVAILQYLDGGRAAALDFANHLLVLEVVNQSVFTDEAQQWTGNFFGHGTKLFFAFGAGACRQFQLL